MGCSTIHLREEPDAARFQIVDCTDQHHVAVCQVGFSFRRFEQCAHGESYIGLHGGVHQGIWRQFFVETIKGRQDVFEEQVDPAFLLGTLKFGGDSRLHRATSFMPHHDEERSMQVGRGILQGAQNGWSQHIAGNPNHEQLAESGVKYKFGRHPAIAATVLAPAEN